MKVVTGTYQGHIEYLRKAIEAVMVDLLHYRVTPMVNAGTWSDSDGVVDRFNLYRCWPTEAQARAYYEQQADARTADLVSKFDDILAMTPLQLMEQQLRELEEGTEAWLGQMEPADEGEGEEVPETAVEAIERWVRDQDGFPAAKLIEVFRQSGIDLPVGAGSPATDDGRAEHLDIGRGFILAKHATREKKLTQRDYGKAEHFSGDTVGKAYRLTKRVLGMAGIDEKELLKYG
ncbi:MAG: hypothetical protein ACE5HA_09000 [Anaerolineae bacterium]